MLRSVESGKKNRTILGLSDFKLKLFINCFYTSYHWFVVEYIFGWRCACAAVFIIFGLGMVLDYVKEKVGLVASIIVHMGADLGVVIAFADIILRAFGVIGVKTPAIFGAQTLPIDFAVLHF
jgi:hypothetical protein